MRRRPSCLSGWIQARMQLLGVDTEMFRVEKIGSSSILDAEPSCMQPCMQTTPLRSMVPNSTFSWIKLSGARPTRGHRRILAQHHPCDGCGGFWCDIVGPARFWTRLHVSIVPYNIASKKACGAVRAVYQGESKLGWSFWGWIQTGFEFKKPDPTRACMQNKAACLPGHANCACAVPSLQ